MTPQDDPNDRRRRLSRRAKVLMLSALAALTLATLYLIEAYRYYHATPSPVVDAYAAFNARNDGFGEDQKAWTVYYDIRYNHWPDATDAIETRMQEIIDAERDRVIDDPFYEYKDPFTSSHNQFGIPPEHPLFADVIALARDFGPQLDRLREAAARPVFGTPITDSTNETITFTPDWFAAPPTADPAKRESIVALYMPGIGVSKRIASMLDLDAQIAADEGDAQRCVDDLIAMLRMARQTAGEPTSIGQMFGLSIQRMACERILRLIDQGVVREQPEPFLALMPELAELHDRPIRIRAEDIRLTLLDWIGHFYTDNGSGNGHITPAGLAMSDTLNVQGQTPKWAIALAWPLRSFVMDRQAAIDHIEAAVDAFIAYQQAGPAGLSAFHDDMAPIIDAEVNGRQPVAQLYIMHTSWEGIIRTESLLHAHVGATVARLALEQHRMQTGTYPNTLAELVPTYLGRLPQDPFDPGQPLRYLLIEGVPHIYSVGSDGDDDQATRTTDDKAREHARDLERRFPGPDSTFLPAPDADWVICPPDP